MNFKDYLTEQSKKHPSVMPQDIVKMCYQAAFGAEHLLIDIKAAEEYFNAEFSSVLIKEKENTADLYESISFDFCRVNLAAWKMLGIPKEWLFEMFKITARQKNADTADQNNIFSGFIKVAEETATSGEFPFGYDDWQSFIEDYEKKGVRPIHHSEHYRNNECPSYRIISSNFIMLIPRMISSVTDMLPNTLDMIDIIRCYD